MRDWGKRGKQLYYNHDEVQYLIGLLHSDATLLDSKDMVDGLLFKLESDTIGVKPEHRTYGNKMEALVGRVRGHYNGRKGML